MSLLSDVMNGPKSSLIPGAMNSRDPVTLANMMNGRENGSTPPLSPQFFFKPTASGKGDGSTIDDAAAWSETALNTAAAAMAAVGGAIYLVGPLTTKARNAARGSDEFDCLPAGYQINVEGVTIDGVKHPLNPDTSDWAYPTFVSNRPAWLLSELTDPPTITDTTGWTVGGNAFHVNAKNVTIRHINGRRLGTFVKQIADHTSDGLIVEDTLQYNIQRLLDQPINVRATATVTFTGTPAAGDTITVKGTTVTFVDVVTSPKVQVLRGASGSAAAQALRTLLNSRTRVFGVTVTGSSSTLTLTAGLTGAAGNGSVSLAKSSSAITLPAANLSGGVTISNDNTTIRRFNVVGVSKACTRIAGNSSGMLIEDFYVDSGWQANDSFARAFSGVDKGKNVIIRNGACANIYEEDGTYYNGDGYNVDDGNENVSITNVTMIRSTDGGADLKGFGHTIDNGRFEKCKRSFRVWGYKVTINGGSSTNPHNSGTTAQELGNGSAHAFVNGYFPTTVDVGSDPFSGDGLTPGGASKYRGFARFVGTFFDGDGDIAGDGAPERLATNFLLTQAPGAVAFFVNCTRRSPTLTAGAIQPLTDANAGIIDIDVGGKYAIFNGNPATIGVAIDIPLTQSAPEGGLTRIPLRATSAAGGVYVPCVWELDETHPGVANGTVTLGPGNNGWARHDPTLTFLAPPAAGGGKLELNITVEDVAGNRVTGLLTVNSTPVGPTQTPLPAGTGPISSTRTAPSLYVSKPTTGVFENDIMRVDIRSNAAGVNHPTMPAGWTQIAALDNTQGTAKTWTFWKRAGASEPDEFLVELWASADESTPSSPVNQTSTHAAIMSVIRYCKTTGDPYENPGVASLNAPAFVDPAPTYWEYASAGPTINTTAGNRFLQMVWAGTNDFVAQEVSPSAAAGYVTDDSQVVQSAAAGDMTFTNVIREAATAGAYPGCKLRWPSKNSSRGSGSMVNVIAWLPRQNP